MNDVAARETVDAIGLQIDQDMSGRVAEARLQPNALLQLMIVIDHNGTTVADDRQHAVLERDEMDAFLAALKAGVPIVIFRAADDVARIREGRHPFAVEEPG